MRRHESGTQMERLASGRLIWVLTGVTCWADLGIFVKRTELVPHGEASLIKYTLAYRLSFFFFFKFFPEILSTPCSAIKSRTHGTVEEGIASATSA